MDSGSFGNTGSNLNSLATYVFTPSLMVKL